MSAKSPNLAIMQHYERHVGAVTAGWIADSSGEDLPIHVLQIPDAPEKGARTLATVGLSKTILSPRVGGRGFRMELMLSAYDTEHFAHGRGLLYKLAMEISASGDAPLRGDVYGPLGRLFGVGSLTSFYFATPAYFPSELAACDAGYDERIAVVWVVPIAEQEAAIVRSRGWTYFEDILAAQDPDVLDLERPSLQS